MPFKKIVAIGPESTGKSSLCAALAAHFNTVWCPEYAREYLLKNGREYTFDNLLDIAKGQIQLEDSYAPASGLFFIDTDMYVMKVWCEFVFGRCHQWILDQIVARPIDLYLLCNTDLPWVEDELREYPDLESRNKLFRSYKDIMINQSTPWVEISGTSQDRVIRAIEAVTQFLG